MLDFSVRTMLEEYRVPCPRNGSGSSPGRAEQVEELYLHEDESRVNHGNHHSRRSKDHRLLRDSN